MFLQRLVGARVPGVAIGTPSVGAAGLRGGGLG
jgi:hypothetical protein